MTKILEGLTLEEECTLMVALKTELLKFKRLLEQDNYSFYKEKVNTIYSIFSKMGYTRKEVDRFINS